MGGVLGYLGRQHYLENLHIENNVGYFWTVCGKAGHECEKDFLTL